MSPEAEQRLVWSGAMERRDDSCCDCNCAL